MNDQNNMNMQNMEQNDYYNNDSYYSNNNSGNYSDSNYEEKKSGGVWWKILLVVLILLIIILLLLKFCTGGSGNKSAAVKYQELTDKLCKASQTYISNNPSVIDSASIGSSAIIKFRTLADANLIEAQVKNPYYDGSLFKKGTQPQYYSMDNSVRVIVEGDGSYRCEIVDNANDVTAPELRLSGDAEITLAVGTEFEDPGYSATDDFDGDVTSKVVRSGSVDYSKAGTYTLTYTVQDSAGNVATKKRTIIYEEYANIEVTLGSILDGVTPMISLKGSNPYCMVLGSQYVEPGATATDNVDGNITNRISVTNKVTGNLMGAFRVVYKVEDSSGNQAIAYRAVIVTTSCPEEKPNNNNDDNGYAYVNNAPVITLLGKSSVTINKGDAYIDYGATAYDKEDGDITANIITDATGVNANVAGVYRVLYRVTDSGGKTSNASRTVTVKEPTSGNASVRFTGSKENITVTVGEGNDTYLDAPKAVNENGVPVAVSMRIEDYLTKKAVSAIDWNKTGKYRVIYTAIHGNGINKQTKSIIVTIVDGGDVEIGGKDEIEVPLRTERCELTEADLIRGGVTFATTTGGTPIVTIEYVDEDVSGIACLIGSYDVIVTAKVGNDNSVSKLIKVKVVDNGGSSEPISGAPSKVVITSNSANPADPYNAVGRWVGGAVTGIDVTFSATPAAGTSIGSFEYSKDCIDSDGTATLLTNTAGSLRWTIEGQNNVCIRAVNTDGVAGPWSNPVKLRLDLTGPKAEFTHTWKDGKDDWHNSESLTLTYKATETGSGLDHFEYTFDDVKVKKTEEIVTYNESTGKLTVHEKTEASRPQLYVYIRAVDKAGNKGEWTKNPAYANIDTVKPEVPVMTVTGNNSAMVKLTAAFTDGKSTRPSGFGKLIYTLNGGDEKTEPSKTITLTSKNKTNYDVRVWAVDKAGNRSNEYANETVTVTASTSVNGVEIRNGNKVVNGKSCGSLGVNGTLKLTANAVAEIFSNELISKCMIEIENGEKGGTLSNISLSSNCVAFAQLVESATWASEDTNIATVKNGKVSGKKAGTTKITATIGDKTAFCNLTVSDSMITCAAGTYLPKGSKTCQTCPAGYYCPGGSYPENPSEDTGKKPCATGYTSAAGATKCTAKSVKVTFHKNDGTDATVSQRFTYGEKGNRFGYNTDGKPRWEQTKDFGKWGRSGYKLLGWSTDKKATAKQYAKYSDVSDNWINSHAPSIDLYAVWQKNGSSTPTTPTTPSTPTTTCKVANCEPAKCSGTKCTKCKDGYELGKADSKNEGVCVKKSGTCDYKTAGYGLVNGVCQQCKAGTFSPAGSSTCTICPQGTYSSAGAGKCSTCKAGYISGNGASKCVACKKGTYSSTAGAAKCTSCPSGMTTSIEGATSSVHCIKPSTTSSCPAGQYFSGGNCAKCPKGTYSKGGTVTSCTSCAAGTFSPYAGAQSCNKCPAGTYSKAGSTSCTSCGLGTYSSSGASSCLKCPGGTYNNRTGASSCSKCNAGYYSTGGASWCTMCSANTYSSTGASKCTKCPAGKSSTMGSSVCR